jgi:hypothetical protein
MVLDSVLAFPLFPFLLDEKCISPGKLTVLFFHKYFSQTWFNYFFRIHAPILKQNDAIVQKQILNEMKRNSILFYVVKDFHGPLMMQHII